MSLSTIAAGWLVWLIVGHFAGDWLFQPHKMALAKTSDPWVRAKHCLIWTVCVMIPVSVRWWHSPCEWGIAALAWFWMTHFWIDSYKPLFWFRRHVSGDPAAESWDTFKAEFGTPRGFVVYVTLDQVFHVLTLIPVAFWLAVRQ